MNIDKNLTSINYTKLINKKNKYIVIHYTANNGDTAYSNTKYFKSINRKASAHYFVDDNSIWQCVEDNYAAWHCGANKYYSNARNSNSIGIEMCSRKKSTGQYYITSATVENTVKLTKYLMLKYNIPIENIVRHYDVTRKVCPRPFVEDITQWEDFKRKVVEYDYEEEEMINELVSTYGENIVKSALIKLCESEKNKEVASEWAIKEIKEAIAAGITDGARPNDFATRQEVMLMTYRAQKK